MSTLTVQTIQGQATVVKSIGTHLVAISGRFPRIARLRSEPYVHLAAPEDFIQQLKTEGLSADIFTFLQALDEPKPRYSYRWEPEGYALLPISTYEHWWKKQIDAKTRNMVRKAEKSGVQLRLVEFCDSFVNGIRDIYNETPVRQRKAFWHYGKDFETIKREHATFLECSQFIGAFLGDELIGFAKLVRHGNIGSLMQIISRIAHRDKAPMNALIAKAVDMCAEANIPYLQYGVWGSGGLTVFKASHAFERHDVPRYFVPLNARGRLALKANLHRKWTDTLPEKWIEFLRPLRQKLNLVKYRVK